MTPGTTPGASWPLSKCGALLQRSLRQETKYMRWVSDGRTQSIETNASRYMHGMVSDGRTQSIQTNASRYMHGKCWVSDGRTQSIQTNACRYMHGKCWVSDGRTQSIQINSCRYMHGKNSNSLKKYKFIRLITNFLALAKTMHFLPHK